MYKKILKTFILTLTLLAAWQCTPDNRTIAEPPVTEPVYSIKLWTMIPDTFRVIDSSSVLQVYADVLKDSLIISDSTLVRFYASFGSITAQSVTVGGQAAAEYRTAFIDSTTILTGNLQIRASVAGGGKIIYDTLSIFVKDESSLKKNIE